MPADRNELEDLNNDLISVIWPFLDRHSDGRGDVNDAVNNVLDSWTPHV